MPPAKRPKKPDVWWIVFRQRRRVTCRRGHYQTRALAEAVMKTIAVSKGVKMSVAKGKPAAIPKPKVSKAPKVKQPTKQEILKGPRMREAAPIAGTSAETIELRTVPVAAAQREWRAAVRRAWDQGVRGIRELQAVAERAAGAKPTPGEVMTALRD